MTAPLPVKQLTFGETLRKKLVEYRNRFNPLSKEKLEEIKKLAVEAVEAEGLKSIGVQIGFRLRINNEYKKLSEDDFQYTVREISEYIKRELDLEVMPMMNTVFSEKANEYSMNFKIIWERE